jgi:serine/threonine protein kinase
MTPKRVSHVVSDLDKRDNLAAPAMVGPQKKSRSIGHYIIGKNIGEGTFGKVKLGTHILTGEKVGNLAALAICLGGRKNTGKT